MDARFARGTLAAICVMVAASASMTASVQAQTPRPPAAAPATPAPATPAPAVFSTVVAAARAPALVGWRQRLLAALRSDCRRGAHRSERAVKATYSAACAAGSALACDLGAQTRDQRRACAAARATGPMARCARSDPLACLLAGWMVWPPPSDQATAAAATSLTETRRRLRRGCLGGVPLACVHLSDVEEQLAAGARVIVAIRQASCAAGHAEGCARFGLHLSEGRGMSPDRPRAGRLFQRACSGGSSLGCRHRADLLLQHAGAKVAWRQALRAYERGCQLGDMVACHRSALLYRDGHADGVGAVQARYRLRQACAGGVTRACDELARARASERRLRLRRSAGASSEPGRFDHVPQRGHRPTESYGGWLAASYIAGPVLMVPTSGVSLLLPSIAHLGYGQGLRGLAALGAIAVTPVIGVTAALIANGQRGSLEGFLLTGLLTTTGLYVGWAIYDVSNNSDVPRTNLGGLSATPYLNASDSGIMLGVTGGF